MVQPFPIPTSSHFVTVNLPPPPPYMRRLFMGSPWYSILYLKLRLIKVSKRIYHRMNNRNYIEFSGCKGGLTPQDNKLVILNTSH